MVIIPLAVIELKITPNGKPTDDLEVLVGRNLALSMLYSATPQVDLLSFTSF